MASQSHEHLFAEEFSEFLGSRIEQTGPAQRRIQALIVDLIRALEEGHTCLPLSAADRQLLQACNLTSSDGTTPLVIADSKLYLCRYYQYEQRLARQLVKRGQATIGGGARASHLNRWFCPSTSDPYQRAAAWKALTKNLTIITGGPGTGKTATVVTIAAMLIECHGKNYQIALAAPTGKAAMRMQESIRLQLQRLQIPDDILGLLPKQAHTLHRLLKVIPYSPYFQHNQQNPLPWDMIVVDEASMVDLALMSKLVDSLKPSSQLILVGDRDQLSSVESGAVLTDCVETLVENIVELKNTYRFNSQIKRLSEAVKKQDIERVEELLGDPQITHACYLTGDPLDYAIGQYRGYLQQAQHTDVQDAESLNALFDRFELFQVLCGVKQGRRGMEAINQHLEQALGVLPAGAGTENWYCGKPIMITRNDYQLGLFNGDIGLCLPGAETGDGYQCYFKNTTAFRTVHPARIVAHQTAWAITVHKSQGSEFQTVALILPENDQPVVSRELIYTAITRCKESVLIASSPEILASAISKSAERNSGLAAHILAFSQEV